jgi:hypothetical protein
MIKKIWNSLLVTLRIRPCCKKQHLVSKVDTVQYYEYVCTNCKHVYSGGGFTRQL